MGIRNIFEHKYPITNLHELDLSYLHAEIDEMISILESWEALIEELKEGLKVLNSLDDRVKYLENITAGLNKAYSDINDLKLDNVKIHEQLNQIEADFEDLINSWNEMFLAYSASIRALLQAEKNERVNADMMLNAALYSFKYQVENEFNRIYEILNNLKPEKVYNPGIGYKLNLNQNTRQTYIDLRDKGISIMQLLERHPIVDDISDKYTCNDLAIHGLKIFKYIKYLYSPGNGIHQTIHQTFSDIFALIHNSSTYNDVIAANLSYDDFVALDKTCLELLNYQF